MSMSFVPESSAARRDAALPRAGSVPGPRPRVLHVVETWAPVSSGYTRRGWQIVAAQAATGVCEPYVLVSSRQMTYGHQTAEMPAGAAVDSARVVAPSRFERGVRRLRPYQISAGVLADAIVATCHEWQIDIIHCHWSSAIGAAARRAAERTGCALVGEVRFDLAGAMMSETIRRPVPGLETLLRTRFDRYLLGADAIVAASHSLARLISCSQPLRKAPVEVMPNAVDTERFQPDPQAAAGLRASLGLEAAFVVGSTTNMLRYEGLDVLLEAIARLSPRLPGLCVVLVGGGTQYEALARQAEARGLPVRFVGRVAAEAVPAYLNLFDLFVVPRREAAVTRHASPIKLVEAMACGVPAVGSALGDIPDILAGGGGRSIPPDDPVALAQAICDFARDDTQRAKAARRAREWALAQPDWLALAERYGALYEQVQVERGGR
ncbi:glycosyltransferase family 4 protein [Salinisphaera sp. SPP-AMP-43]|uniref:glycosyltransferase family 4 protein n=1 Tax=Salinisphaera sp. SPP-AMP-43 TaxID=3121288 RepID=UPI003C6E533F